MQQVLCDRSVLGVAPSIPVQRRAQMVKGHGMSLLYW